MTTEKNQNEEENVRTFDSVVTPEKMKELDNLILKDEEEYKSSLRQAMNGIKDFVITH